MPSGRTGVRSMAGDASAPSLGLASPAVDPRIALYFQDKHSIAYELEMARYAEERGITEIWQADTRLARDCVLSLIHI